MGIFLFNATTDDLEESGEAVDIVDSNENSSGSICTSSTSVDGVPASVQDSSAATSTPVVGWGGLQDGWSPIAGRPEPFRILLQSMNRR